MSTRTLGEVRSDLDRSNLKHDRLRGEIRDLEARIEDGEDTPGIHERLENLHRGEETVSARIKEIRDEYSVHVLDLAQNPRSIEVALSEAENAQPPRTIGESHQLAWRKAGRDGAMRAIERLQKVEGFDNRAAKRVETMLRVSDRDGLDARYVAAVGNPHYASAFAKALPNPTTGHLSFTPQEAEAMRVVRQVEEQRGMSVSVGAQGGFGLPIEIDPTIVITNAGALNPLREIARVETISTYVWRGISTDGAVAQFQAEGAEVPDNSATLVQPTMTAARGTSFIPFTFEVNEDYPDWQSRLAAALIDAKNILEATKFLTGLGNGNEPGGILNIGATGGLVQANSRVQTATSTTLAYADIWTLKQAIPVRFLANATVVAHPTTFDSIYQLSPAGSTTLALQMPQGRGGPIVGLPQAQLSSLGTGTAANTRVAIAGDFKTGFLIGDRLGAQVEIVPHLVGAANRFPVGMRGMLLWWRVASTTIGAASAAGCPLRYLEIKP